MSSTCSSTYGIDNGFRILTTGCFSERDMFTSVLILKLVAGTILMNHRYVKGHTTLVTCTTGPDFLFHSMIPDIRHFFQRFSFSVPR